MSSPARSGAGVPAASDLDLLDSDVEEDLRSSLRAMLAVRCRPDAVLTAYDGDGPVRGPLWSALAGELGLAGLLVPERHGGSGAGAREAAVVLHELGRVVAPVPYLTSAVLAAAALLPCDDPAVLAPVATGRSVAALAVPFTATARSLAPAAGAEGGAVSGRVPVVAGAVEADLLLVPAVAGDRVDLHVVEAAGPGVTVTPAVSLDMTRQVADIALDGARGRVVLRDAGPAVRGALALAAALLPSEQVGVAERCLEDTVAHLRQRHQFGRALGSFQALKHRVADLAVELDAARAAARYAAAAAAADDPDLPVATAVAQVQCSTTAVHVTEECLQLHGGIGMTWEHPLHLLLKRAKADQLALGSVGEHLASLAELVDLPPPG